MVSNNWDVPYLESYDWSWYIEKSKERMLHIKGVEHNVRLDRFDDWKSPSKESDSSEMITSD